MGTWYTAPVFENSETNRQAQMLWRILKVTLALVLLGTVVALADSRNDPQTTLLFYGPVYLCYLGVGLLVRRGKVVFAAWLLSVFCWLLIAFVTLSFGGLQGQNASVLAVCTLLIGSVVGGRAAIAMAIASSLWCAFVWMLEERDALPFALGPYTPANAWASLTITVIMTSVLLHESLKSLRSMHRQAQQAAKERDEALRDSIRRQKMELVGNLTSGVAHDLNNLLTIIMGTVELLRGSLGAAEPGNEALLDDLEKAANRSSMMTAQLLALGRANVGRSEPVELGALLEVHGRMASRLVGSPIDVEVGVTRGCWVMASRAALEQIVLNLVVNARDAMPSGGKLSIRLTDEGETVRVSVSDTGVGIPPEVAQRIFEPFFTTKTNGTGLGLATIQRLLTQFGGNITVESEVGVGTTFHIGFPKIPAPARGQIDDLAPLSAPPRVGVGKRILLAEDDPAVRKALTQMLSLDGYDVTAVADGDEALAMLPIIDRFACVVTDISMRHVDGDELADKLGTASVTVPVLILSGNREPKPDAGNLRRVFLPKPLTHDDLRRALHDIIPAVAAPGSVRGSDFAEP